MADRWSPKRQLMAICMFGPPVVIVDCVVYLTTGWRWQIVPLALAYFALGFWWVERRS